MEKKDNREKNVIPFMKPARVGNYKLWRSRASVTVSPTDEQRAKVREESAGRRKAVSRKMDVDVINISSLDGLWKVQIPSTMQMYGTICQGYAVEDDSQRDMFLRSVIGNFYNVTTNPSVYLHDAFAFLTEMFTFPYMLLPEKEMVRRMKEGFKKNGIDRKKADGQIDQMVKLRKKLYGLIDRKIADFISYYELHLSEARSSEDESMKALEQDDIAGQAMDILSGKDA